MCVDTYITYITQLVYEVAERLVIRPNATIIVRNQLSNEKVNSWDSMIQKPIEPQQFIEKLNYVIDFMPTYSILLPAVKMARK